jgi:HEAT repeat protein
MPERSTRLAARTLAALIGVAGLASAALGQTTRPSPWLDYGRGGIEAPAAVRVSLSTPRLAQVIAAQMVIEASGARRAQLAGDLATAAQPDSVPPLRKALGDPDPRVRAAACAGLAALKDAASLDAIRALLKDAEPSVRAAAVDAATTLGAADAVEAGLNDAEVEVAAAALRHLSTPEHDAAAARKLTTWPAATRAFALRQLGRRGAAAQVDAIVAQLRDGPLVARVAAADALGQLRSVPPAAADALKVSAGNAHPSVRRAAVFGYGSVAEPAAAATFAIDKLNDADPTVREAACRVLQAKPTPAAIEPLVAQLGVGYGPLRVAARDALVATGAGSRPQVEAAAAGLIRTADARRQEDGSFVLGRLRSDVALDDHIKLLASPDMLTTRQAAESLGRIGRNEAGPAMVTTFTRLQGQVGKQPPEDSLPLYAAGEDVIVAAARLGHRPILQLTRPLVGNKNAIGQWRSAAIWAVGVIEADGKPDEGTMRALIARTGDPEESSDVIFESIKTLGAARYQPAEKTLRSLARTGPDEVSQYVAHLGADRIAGTQTPYQPPTLRRRPETTILDLKAE